MNSGKVNTSHTAIINADKRRRDGFATFALIILCVEKGRRDEEYWRKAAAVEMPCYHHQLSASIVVVVID